MSGPIIATAILVMEIARRNGVPAGEIMLIVLLSMFLSWMEFARADALWDFYFGPDAVRCDAIGTTPELAVAVTHRLNVAGHPEKLRAWFAAHPQYQAEVDAKRAYYEQNCRDTD